MEIGWPMCPGLLGTFPRAQKVSRSVKSLSPRQTRTLVTLWVFAWPNFLSNIPLPSPPANANVNITIDWALQCAKHCTRRFIYSIPLSLHNDSILQRKLGISGYVVSWWQTGYEHTYAWSRSFSGTSNDWEPLPLRGSPFHVELLGSTHQVFVFDSNVTYLEKHSDSLSCFGLLFLVQIYNNWPCRWGTGATGKWSWGMGFLPLWHHIGFHPQLQLWERPEVAASRHLLKAQ